MISVINMDPDREGPMEDGSVGCQKKGKEGDAVKVENDSTGTMD